MKEYQTPLKELSRSSSSSARKFKESQLKKPQKIVKKSLNGEFSSAAEVSSPGINNELSDFSPLPDISDANHCGQTAQKKSRLKWFKNPSKITVQKSFKFQTSLMLIIVAKQHKYFICALISVCLDKFSPSVRIPVSPLNPALWASTDTFSVSDLTPTSEISTITDGPGSVENYGLGKLCGSKIGPVEGLEADVVVKLLKEARIEVSNSDARSKKVRDAMTKAAMDEYSTLPEEKDWMIDLVSMKGRIVCLCFLIWSFVVSMVFLFGLGSGSSSGGPLPT